jgi:tRNA (adenine57-N1/adenine58-N1)-methyltransferase catalytic subunit
MTVKKVIERKGKRFLWSSGDLNTNYGIVKEVELKSKKSEVVSSTGKTFNVLSANFNDSIKKLKRGPQAMMLKDISYIIFKTGIDAKSKVVEAGTGSGFLTSYLANYGGKITSYDVSKDNQEIARKNLISLGLKVEFKIGDVIENIKEKNQDVVVLDLPNSDKAVENAYDALKVGGYLVGYLPNMTQVVEFVKEAEKCFDVEEVLDIMHVPWLVTGLKAKPQPRDMLHTAFLVFARKVSDKF